MRERLGGEDLESGNFGQKVAAAMRRSREFFDREVVLPDTGLIEKANGVYERLNQLGYTGFEPLVFPRVDFGRNEAGRVKNEPNKFILDAMSGRFPEVVLKLYPGIYLLDTKKKPDYNKGQQRYENDEYMEGLMLELRTKGDRSGLKIKRYGSVPDNSRYGAEPVEEIEDVVIPEFGYRIGEDVLGKGIVKTTRYVEHFSAGYLGFHQLGKGDTLEWFGDKLHEPGLRLYGGRRNLNHVIVPLESEVSYASDFAGFRPMIVFLSGR